MACYITALSLCVWWSARGVSLERKVYKSGYYSLWRKTLSERNKNLRACLNMFNKPTGHARMVVSQTILLLARNPIIGLLFNLAKNILEIRRKFRSLLKYD